VCGLEEQPIRWEVAADEPHPWTEPLCERCGLALSGLVDRLGSDLYFLPR
jgi:hypothetical protein